MKKNEVVVGGHYTAKISGVLTTVRVDAIRETDGNLISYGRRSTIYDVTNLRTGRKTVFHSAAKFRGEVKPKVRGNEGMADRGYTDSELIRLDEIARTPDSELDASEREDQLEEVAKNRETARREFAATEGDDRSDPTPISPAPATEPSLLEKLTATSSGFVPSAASTLLATAPVRGLAARLAQRQTETGPSAPHIVVKALAGTGKTFTQIVGVAWAFGQRIWPKIVRTMAERINQKAGFQKVDPDTFRVVPSAQQQAVWDALALSADSVRTITYCAFNKSIVTEFGEEWGWLVDLLKRECGVTLNFATVNSLGNKAVYRAFGKVDVKGGHVENLIADVLGRDLWDLRRDPKMQTVLSATDELVGLCKLTLTGWTEQDGFDPADISHDDLDQLDVIVSRELNGSRERVYMLVPQVLERCLDVRRNRCIDFNDQNWLPVVLNLPVDRVGLLLVDEGQDLPRCKQEFARKIGSRIGLVGDVNQAIYGFAGADTDSIPRMQALLGVSEPLALTSTRRCGKAIVAEARRIVAEFEAHESNCDGSVREARYTDVDQNKQPILDESGVRVKTYHDDVADGDMVLCRVNAPLVGQALKFLKMGRKVVLRGRDFGGQLASFVKKMNATSPEDLLSKVDDWVVAEQKKENAKRNPSEAKLMSISDRYECVQAFCDGAKSVADVLAKIDLVFAGKICPRCKKHFNETTDTCPEYHCKTIPNPVTGWKEGPKLLRPEGIQFSSIHRAKGLEADRVFFLMPKGGECPHPMAKSDWQRRQEMNCLYIGITRAIKELVYVR